MQRVNNMDDFRAMVEYLPFIGTIVSAHSESGDTKVPPSLIARLLEIAFMCGVMYMAYTKDMEVVKDSIRELKQDLTVTREMKTDMSVMQFKIQNLQDVAQDHSKMLQFLGSELYPERKQPR